jgi:hypothetical protein
MDYRVRPQSGGLLDIMRENVRKLGEIRKLCNKISVIRNIGQAPPGVHSFYCFLILGIPSSGASQTTRIRRIRMGRRTG